jgi:D-sedoheptulose 7-phosphate isomerase
VLGESHSIRSAYTNDRDPRFIYAQELNAFASNISPGVLLGISTSGSATNVIAAATLAKAYQFTTIAFTGPDGGTLAAMSDIAIRTPAAPAATWRVQENQQCLYHALCLMLEAHFASA